MGKPKREKKSHPGEAAVAHLRNARVPPRKARFVVDMIRGRKVAEALALLEHVNRPSAAPAVERLLKSAVSNVDKTAHPNPDELFIGAVWVDGAGMLRRWRPRAFGRAAQIRKRMCHITLVLTQGAAV